MADQSTDTQQDIRYEPDERPPLALSIGLGFHYTGLVAAGIVLTPVMLIKIVAGSEAYLSWAVFAALVISRGHYGGAVRPDRARRRRLYSPHGQLRRFHCRLRVSPGAGGARD